MKTLRKDNPHISKRRGGRKSTHRRFSLQVLFSFEYELACTSPLVHAIVNEASSTLAAFDSIDALPIYGFPLSSSLKPKPKGNLGVQVVRFYDHPVRQA